MGWWRSYPGRAEPRAWHVNRGGLAIETNQPDRFCGQVELAERGSAYVILGMASASFASLPEGAGIAVKPDELHIIDAHCQAEGDLAFTRIVLEYDGHGQRIGTHRAKGEDSLLYIPAPGVERIVACLRIEGEGLATIEHLGWRRDLRFAEAFSASSPVSIRPGGPRQLRLPDEQWQPVALWPRDYVRACVFGLKAGGHALEFMHRDPLLAARRGDFVARLRLSRPLAPDANLALLGLERAEDGALVVRPSLQSRDNGAYCIAANFTLPDNQDWLVVELASEVDRFVNLDSLTIKPAEDAQTGTQDNLLAGEVASFLARTPDAEAITTLLYADISMNVVDGSSVWLSSVATMLAGGGRCLLLSSQNIASEMIRSNIRHAERLTILTPEDLGYPHQRFQIDHACAILRRLDDQLPGVRNVVVRGCDVAEQVLSTRQFRSRAFAYLTDFYELGEEGPSFPERRQKQVAIAATQAAKLLVQTPQIAAALEQCGGRAFEACLLPPSIPPVELAAASRTPTAGRAIRVGYAGKINPQWGILELLDWAERLRAQGVAIELHIASGKISDRSAGFAVAGLRAQLLSRIKALGGQFHGDLNRDDAMRLMAGMDYVWCWRPASLEEYTLELSTKLVEMAALGARCFCWPNAINRELLGEDYPFYITGFEQFTALLKEDRPAPATLAEEIGQHFSQEVIGPALVQHCLNHPVEVSSPRILVSGHGLKFIEPYASHLKASGHHVRRDPWQWSAPFDEEATRKAAQWADVVFCEWGLQNAVWHSQNLRDGARLVVRCHAQEVRERAQKFTSQIDAQAVERFIFVSERIRREAIALYGWAEDKCVTIPNFVLEDEYRFAPRKRDGGAITLGLLGMIPHSKRFDRALDLLAALRGQGMDARLHVKGQQPDRLAYMFAANRREEMAWFSAQYERIESDPMLRGMVQFEDWGNDVAQWYEGIDHILSPSDHESFHYAIADGVLAGCHPVVWQWEDAERVYPADWCVKDVSAAMAQIMAFEVLDEAQRAEILSANRAGIVARYGQQAVYPQLDAMIGLSR